MRTLIPLTVLSVFWAFAACLALEYPFTSADIFGRDSTPGSTEYSPSSDTYTVTANGHDIWDSYDDFRFLYVEMSGDFSVSVRVDDPAGLWPHSWSKAGIMVRQDISPGSKDLYLVATRNNGVAFQWRDSPDSPASWTGSSEPANPLSYPIWLRIVRSGDLFTGWYSTNGTSWVYPQQNAHTLPMADPVLVGICLTSHLSGVPATATFGDFHIPRLEASTVAIPPPDQICHEGDTVFLNGRKSWNATYFLWEQLLLGDEPKVLIPNPREPVATFVAPQLDLGSVLTFRLTAYGPIGKSSALTRVAVKATNAPMIPPPNLRAEIGDLSVTLHWDAILDADCYVVKRAEQPPGGQKSLFQTIRPSVEDTSAVDGYLQHGFSYYYLVAAKNAFPPYEGPPSDEVSITAMPNLALRPDTAPMALVTAPSGGGLKNLNSIMNTITRENYDTFDDYRTLQEDWFGYAWQEALYFDHIVYYEGEHFEDGGWWTSLTVQFSDDCITWREAPNIQITPPCNFADSLLGRKPYSRFDTSFKPVRAKAIRIYGSPGGVAGFTSIAELEVYGNQKRGPLLVYGVDRTVDERSSVTLDASYSFSTRGPITRFHWRQTAGPLIALVGAETANATFIAPEVDCDTPLTFTLTAGDGTDLKTDEVLVLVRNLVTKADAGPDIAALENTLVLLDGTASITTSGHLSYEWTQIAGTLVTLSDSHSPEPSFTAPFIWHFSRNLIFQLRVDDGLGRPDSVSTDTVTVCVKNTLNHMPHVEKSGLAVIEAENFTSINRRNDDRGTWQVFPGAITYVEVPDIPGAGGARTWDESAAEISYQIKIRYPGNYYIKLRRFVPHGAGHEGGTNNSCLVGLDGSVAIPIFDNGGNYSKWGWASNPQPLPFPQRGTYSLDIRCREDGYRIDRIVLYQPGASAVPADWSSEVGPPESLAETKIVCSRQLGSYYTPGTIQPVSLHIDVNVPVLPATLTLVEQFPEYFSIVDSSSADAATPGCLTWTFSAQEISNRTVTYTLVTPGNATLPAEFHGYLSYGDVTHEHVAGETILYPLPAAPSVLDVEILHAAAISWLPSPDTSVIAYHVYRSSDGEHWTDVSGPRRQSPFVDSTVQPGTTYIYKVSSENPAGVQTPLSLCRITAPQPCPYMEVREAEDYDYGGGLFPGGPGAPPAKEASRKSDLSPGLDYYYQNLSRTNSYRPQDQVDIRPGEGSSGWFMGYSTPGDWWRYTFAVPVAGYVKLVYRGSTSPSASASIEFLWDEKSVGTITFNTPGGWRDWTYFPLQPFFSGRGKHVLRMRLASGSADHDLLALGYDWTFADQKVVYAEDFNAYSDTSELQSLGGWTILSASSSPGAWQLWSTDGDLLANDPNEPGPALPGMARNYALSNGYFAPDADLDEQLISPEIDCTNYDWLSVQFSSHINIFGQDPDGNLQTTDFDISIYDPYTQSWSDWANIFTHDRSDGDQSSTIPLAFGIPSFADGKKMRLRWHFYNTRSDYWWAVDNIILCGRPTARPKILVLTLDGTGTVVLSWQAFGTGYYAVQYTDDLQNSSWTDAAGETWPIIKTTFSLSLPPGQTRRFYRVISR